MKALSKPTIMLLFIAVMSCIVSCTKPNNNNSSGNSDDDVIVTTYTPSDVTASTAVSGCSVQVRQGLSLSKIGVCWSTSANPTADNSQLSSEAWNEPFVKTLTGLSPNTTYHVRAFALRGLEYYYGEDKTFTTLAEGGGNNGGGNGGGNNGGGNTPVLPTVTTLQMTDITQTSAVAGGYVTEDGGATVLERGICWSTTTNPTTSDSYISNGSGTGNYTITISDLMPCMTYHVRAYAINSVGTGYGSDVSFTTLPGGGGFVTPEAPTGAIRGLFSVSPSKQVWFSKGNLQYIGSASTPYWKFAEHQWDFFGDNGQASVSPNKNYDLFAWGTSGYNHGAACYQPWEMGDNTAHDAYGIRLADLCDCDGKADWGYNAISNGGNTAHQWRTPTADEWNYVFNSRMTNSGIRYARGKVNGKRGVILLPDSWDASIYTLYYTNEQPTTYPLEDFCLKNIISSSIWTNKFEANGAIFLPFCGDRYSSGGTIHVHKVDENTKNGWYQSSSCSKDNYPWLSLLSIVSYSGVGIQYTYTPRSIGNPVRLVQDYQ